MKRHVVLLPALAVTALLVSCSNDDTAAPTTEAPTTEAPTTVTPTTAAPTTAAPTTAAPATTYPSDPAAKAAIVAAWEKFINKSSNVTQRLAVLEAADALTEAINLAAKNPVLGQADAKVKDVIFTAKDRARVIYDVIIGGSVALPDSEGIAVLVGSDWKVSKSTFCALAALAIGGSVPGC
ncbi:MAG: hypothetical protein RL219_1607 [Actinomycetota bacterium]|jgi:PBP1b-binding outer membrane lipoprotein LpoB